MNVGLFWVLGVEISDIGGSKIRESLKRRDFGIKYGRANGTGI